MMMRTAAALMCLAALATAARLPQQQGLRSARPVNNRPIIGVLTQFGMKEDAWFLPENNTYVASSYVRFLQGGGARVVPILQDMPPEQLKKLFSKLNGILFPGGAAQLYPGHPFFDTAQLVFDLAKASNDKGDHFPLMGICLGMETLAVIVSGTHDILSAFDSEGTAAPLYFTSEAPDSHFFSGWDLDLALDVLKQPLTRESHTRGISLRHFEANPELSDFFRVLSLSADKEGKVYVSSLESKRYPIVALQWHPEKDTYEFSGKNIPHSEMAVEVTHQAARFFVNETRFSARKFADVVEEDLWLIHNDRTVFSGKHSSPDDDRWADEVYVFPPWEEYSQQLADRAQGTTHEREYARRYGAAAQAAPQQ